MKSYPVDMLCIIYYYYYYYYYYYCVNSSNLKDSYSQAQQWLELELMHRKLSSVGGGEGEFNQPLSFSRLTDEDDVRSCFVCFSVTWFSVDGGSGFLGSAASPTPICRPSIIKARSLATLTSERALRMSSVSKNLWIWINKWNETQISNGFLRSNKIQ